MRNFFLMTLQIYHYSQRKTCLILPPNMQTSFWHVYQTLSNHSNHPLTRFVSLLPPLHYTFLTRYRSRARGNWFRLSDVRKFSQQLSAIRAHSAKQPFPECEISVGYQKCSGGFALELFLPRRRKLGRRRWCRCELLTRIFSTECKHLLRAYRCARFGAINVPLFWEFFCSLDNIVFEYFWFSLL